MPRVQVSNADKQKSYYKYFLQPMAPGPQEVYDKIKAGPSVMRRPIRILYRNEFG